MAPEHLCINWNIEFPECRGISQFRSCTRKLKSGKWYLICNEADDSRKMETSVNTVQLHRENDGKRLQISGIFLYLNDLKIVKEKYLDCIMDSYTKKTENIFEFRRNTFPENLVLRCEAWITELPLMEEKSLRTLPTYLKLSRDMCAMYEKQDHSDFTVICKDVEIRVHKCILAARSPVFAKMFQHPTTERSDNRMVITDLDPDTFEDLMQFLYCGKINSSTYRKVYNLYYAAEKYFVSDLKRLCRDYIISSLSSTTAVETLILADRHSDKKMTQKAIAYIASSFHYIKLTEPWTFLLQEYPPLASQVLSLVEEEKSQFKNHDFKIHYGIMYSTEP